ncbi:DUF445 domain-containing protein [Gynurincola endophyticus]|uniref:DUF445 domain-containing protein n=1 Tax=Gynurincola endophyticus TaxID=2479004 RepID=UPI000F8D2610|nr:DUF445 family protein [Gynurincola endophyticus]
MSWTLIIIPIIAGFIGWITNLIAIRMLFHPKQPVNILGYKLQGVFPKRQDAFAQKLGKLVSDELLSFADIEQKIANPANVQKVLPLVETHIDDFLRVRLKEKMPVISMFIGDKTIQELKAVFMGELEALFPQLLSGYINSMKNELDLEKIVYEKVKNFSSDKLESILYQILSKEFRYIEIIGGILGFLIGVIQVILSVFILK